jgi:hypothetical protein
MPILSSTGASSAKAYGFGGQVVIPGNSGILTSGTSYVLPITSGQIIKVIVVAGGGGGGGGSGRTSFAGYFTGGGGGASAAAAYATNILVTAGQTINFSIGSAGTAGSPRDGIYTSGSSGGTGGTTSVTVNSTVVARVFGGTGGLVSPNATGGSGGSVSTGTQILSTTAGGAAAGGATTGGQAARGYTITTTVGTALGSIVGYGNYGTISGAEGSGVPPTPGTIYGAGGGGGGCAQSDVFNPGNISPNAGTTGAVFIWWGY